MPKVSIIIPAYNIENYITRCLNSIINQTFRDIEIIVVNDGSTDLTLKKIKEKTKEDKRIRIIDKKNEGSIEARKDGFKQALGEYILFVDGDDYLDQSTVEILYNKSKEKNYDIVCFKILIAHENGINEKRKEKQFNMDDDHYFLKLLLTSQISPSLCNKFIKKSFVYNNNITFPKNISYAEDLAFSCSLAMHNPKVCMVDQYLYYYFSRENSITKIFSTKVLDTVKAFNFINDEMEKSNIKDKYIEEFEYLAYMHNYYYRRNYIYEFNNNLSKILYIEWRKMDIYIYTNKYYSNFVKNMTFKERLALKIFERIYILGRLYNRLKN
ncbi:glycosyltransferase family 2 protein [Priestia aryabhattai]|uniref:glycosyltransferase family 2 protein n=1 Tax=Priestia aryabhattai TaxID=412384 RepID=UPI000C069E7A|nr:glycosyltransferase family 2 protein [Priestia aryabhattai]